ncbi:MAG: hypothetical protein ACYCVW_17030 [Rhodocyclaceae bacterium]
MPDWFVQVLGAFCGAAGVYAAIRADLAYLRAKAESAEASASRAHVRLDDFLQLRG